MSKKKDRAWFVCRTWPEIISRHYATDAEAARALHADPKVLAKLRAGTPVAKATVMKMLRRVAAHHELAEPAAALVRDTRTG
jgi:hypothetical protein